MVNTNQLLVLGNGFDLTADHQLQSTFDCFIKNKYSNMFEYTKSIKDILSKEKYEQRNVNNQMNNINNYSIDSCLKRFIFFKLQNNKETDEKLINNLIKNKIIKVNDSFKKLIELINKVSNKENNFNIWTLYLLLYKDELKNWNDVEKCIDTFLKDKYHGLLTNYPAMFIEESVIKQILILSQNKKIINTEIYYNKFLNSNNSEKRIEEIKIEDLIYCYLFIIKNNYYSYNLNKINKILTNEIYDFEMEFNYYLINRISQSDYGNKSSKLIDKLALNKKFKLLNFNYTNPMSDNLERSINIHGKLLSYKEIENFLINKKDKEYLGLIDKYSSQLIRNPSISDGDKLLNLNKLISTDEKKSLNIKISKLISYHPIIGISDSEINRKDKFIYSFTKTFRRMGLLSNINKSSDVLLSNDIDKIMFFGHSFSEADYPYFKTIFNKFNIFNNKVSLVFYYINHGGKTDYDQKIKQINLIYDLIFKYYNDSSINREYNYSFSDMMDKMQLEERISVVNIKNINY